MAFHAYQKLSENHGGTVKPCTDLVTRYPHPLPLPTCHSVTLGKNRVDSPERPSASTFTTQGNGPVDHSLHGVESRGVLVIALRACSE
jgi:hypothetical protein